MPSSLGIVEVEPVFLSAGNPGIGVSVGFVGGIEQVDDLQPHFGTDPPVERPAYDEVMHPVRIQRPRPESAVVEVLASDVFSAEVDRPRPPTEPPDRGPDDIRRERDRRVAKDDLRLTPIVEVIHKLGEPRNPVLTQRQVSAPAHPLGQAHAAFQLDARPVTVFHIRPDRRADVVELPREDELIVVVHVVEIRPRKPRRAVDAVSGFEVVQGFVARTRRRCRARQLPANRLFVGHRKRRVRALSVFDAVHESGLRIKKRVGNGLVEVLAHAGVVDHGTQKRVADVAYLHIGVGREGFTEPHQGFRPEIRVAFASVVVVVAVSPRVGVVHPGPDYLAVMVAIVQVPASAGGKLHGRREVNLRRDHGSQKVIIEPAAAYQVGAGNRGAPNHNRRQSIRRKTVVRAEFFEVAESAGVVQRGVQMPVVAQAAGVVQLIVVLAVAVDLVFVGEHVVGARIGGEQAGALGVGESVLIGVEVHASDVTAEAGFGDAVPGLIGALLTRKNIDFEQVSGPVPAGGYVPGAEVGRGAVDESVALDAGEAAFEGPGVGQESGADAQCGALGVETSGCDRKVTKGIGLQRGGFEVEGGAERGGSVGRRAHPALNLQTPHGGGKIGHIHPEHAMRLGVVEGDSVDGDVDARVVNPADADAGVTHPGAGVGRAHHGGRALHQPGDVAAGVLAIDFVGAERGEGHGRVFVDAVSEHENRVRQEGFGQQIDRDFGVTRARNADFGSAIPDKAYAEGDGSGGRFQRELSAEIGDRADGRTRHGHGGSGERLPGLGIAHGTGHRLRRGYLRRQHEKKYQYQFGCKSGG
jgi:hypothetical protein